MAHLHLSALYDTIFQPLSKSVFISKCSNTNNLLVHCQYINVFIVAVLSRKTNVTAQAEKAWYETAHSHRAKQPVQLTLHKNSILIFSRNIQFQIHLHMVNKVYPRRVNFDSQWPRYFLDNALYYCHCHCHWHYSIQRIELEPRVTSDPY